MRAILAFLICVAAASAQCVPPGGSGGGGAPSGAAGGGLGGTYPNPSVKTVAGDLTLSGTLTPTALSGNVNDYDPTGCSTALALRIDGGAADRNITGLACGTPADGRIVEIINIGTTNNLVLVNQSASSTAANRFLIPNDVTLSINTALALRYDGTSARWRPLSRALANTGVAAGTYMQVSVDVAGRVTAGQATLDPSNIITGATFTFGNGSYTAGIYHNQHATAATAVTGTLPTAADNDQFCLNNSYNGSAANTGVLTVQTSAAGQYIIYTDGTLSATGGYVSTAGAAGDSLCVVGVDSTHWRLVTCGNGNCAKH